MDNAHEIAMKAAVAAAGNSSMSDEQRIEAAVKAYLKSKDEVLVDRPLLKRLYTFFNDAWVGHQRETSEGSFGKDLLDWRNEVGAYYNQDIRPFW